MFCHWVGRLVRRLVGGRVFSSLLGAGEVPGGGGFCFQVKRVLHVFCACGGISETRMSVFVFWF